MPLKKPAAKKKPIATKKIPAKKTAKRAKAVKPAKVAKAVKAAKAVKVAKVTKVAKLTKPSKAVKLAKPAKALKRAQPAKIGKASVKAPTKATKKAPRKAPPRRLPPSALDKLLSAILAALEDGKAQEISAFDTQELTPWFERVVIASGQSNRQTRALAQRVSDAARACEGTKPRIEGEEEGRWIIADCGAVVVHILQPQAREMYRLEELWGGKAVSRK